MYKKRRTDDSLERDGRPDERRVGRLEAVALERPQIQFVVERVLGVELGHEVLHGRRRAGRAVRRAMCTINRACQSKGWRSESLTK